MTKRHFRSIATAIRHARFASPVAKEQFVTEMCEILARTNPNFRFSTFREACESQSD